MDSRFPALVSVEWALLGAGVFLSVLTLTWPEWIEAVFRVDPDSRGGSLEWAIAGALLALALALAVARRLPGTVRTPPPVTAATEMARLRRTSAGVRERRARS